MFAELFVQRLPAAMVESLAFLLAEANPWGNPLTKVDGCHDGGNGTPTTQLVLINYISYCKVQTLTLWERAALALHDEVQQLQNSCASASPILLAILRAPQFESGRLSGGGSVSAAFCGTTC